MDKHAAKNKAQLGMNPATAQHRLRYDLLFRFAVGDGHKCFQCGNDLVRDDFSIEHKIPWLDSEDPVGLFFDLENIAFSHKSCNFRAARKPHQRFESEAERYKAELERKREKRLAIPAEERQKKRREQYLKYGT